MSRTTAVLAALGAMLAATLAYQRLGHMPQSMPETSRFLGNILGGAITGLLIAWAYERSKKSR